MNRSKILVDLANILVETFNKSGKEDTVENYINFVQEFAKEHSMEIYGTTTSAEGAWKTTGFKFNNDEAEVFFKLKYGGIEVS